MLARALSKPRLIAPLRRHYGAPAAVASDPRKDKTVQLTHSRGVNVTHDPLLSKGKACSLVAYKHITLFCLLQQKLS